MPRKDKSRNYWVAIKCPNSGFPVPTGISASKESFEGMALINNQFSCSICGRMHSWSKQDSFLVVPSGEYNEQEFEDDVLVLDGSSFNKCIIRNCEIHLSRGNFRLTNSKILGSKFGFSGEAAVVRTIVDSLKGS